ncbi:HNH endonuclease [Pseudomonas viridiflava]|uniref:HNH endonuclease n=1 Tax=Pseudomonas viridiflava TaxID=33069 RepID=A0AA46VX46_PSEVI|nr:HNH endonuclease [Pseudomonas viridiflava]UZA68687.1 HNH endonuclease [Pseudomonas viridiflava]
MKCIICNKEKEKDEFSLEHILPQSLGGALCPDEFKTRRVCRPCNSIMGLFVDAQLTKGVLGQNGLATAALHYFDPDNLRVIPLQYLGHVTNLLLDEQFTCELWLGTIGGLVYHRRRKSDSKFDFFAGGNPINLKKFGGEAYIFTQHQDEFWNMMFLVSAREKFKNSKLISGNVNLPADPDFFSPTTNYEKKFLAQLQSKQGKEHDVTFKILHGFEQRFLCKFALAYGHNRLGEEFIESSYALKLRNALWEKNSNMRASLGISFNERVWVDDDETWSHLAWPGIHTIAIVPEADKLLAVIYLFGTQLITITLSDDPIFWRGKITSSEVHVICQTLNQHAGPFLLENFVAHRLGGEQIPELLEIDYKEFDVADLPSFDELRY